ncbi:MAG: cell division topological specificity factor MinE [Bdellovibrionales bacterium]|nr:cell division topological specificity factor MinE [Bdellovibrionales bacterium]
MFKTLRNALFGGEKASGKVAKSRLHFVLVQDRAGLTNEEMASFRKELVDVINRYFVIDEQGFDIDYERSGDSTTLVINSPVVVRRQEGFKGDVGARRNSNKRNSPISRPAATS